MIYISYMHKFVYSYQTLIAGIIAIVAAWITTRPLWHQLNLMSAQTNTNLRDFLRDHLRICENQHKWVSKMIYPVMEDIKIYIDSYSHSENKYPCAERAFELSATIFSLRTEVENYLKDSTINTEIAASIIRLCESFDKLSENFENIHRPYSQQQNDEHNSFTDKQWKMIKKLSDISIDAISNEFVVTVGIKNYIDSLFGAEKKNLINKLEMTSQILVKYISKS